MLMQFPCQSRIMPSSFSGLDFGQTFFLLTFPLLENSLVVAARKPVLFLNSSRFWALGLQMIRFTVTIKSCPISYAEFYMNQSPRNPPSLHFLKDVFTRSLTTCDGNYELFEYVVVSGWEEITESEYQSLQAEGWSL